ncbi:MAG TPA: Hsp70 family protein [Pyrinomonadaceae bacterium]|nr:Hsp70 family protein [Pyrinomonadaceae bacterium]
MTRVSFTLNYDEMGSWITGVPIEIRRLDLALVERGVSAQQFNLSEGNYFVTSLLPDGRRLFAHAAISGREKMILLSSDPDYESDSNVNNSREYLAIDLLSQYLAKGYAREAAALAQWNYSRITDSNEDQNWVLPTLYTLLRFGELRELADMINQRGQWHQAEFTSADSSVIRGEILARLGRHQQAFSAFLELESRGVPAFTDGLFYAKQRLQIYRHALEMGSLKNEISAYAILGRLQRIAAYQSSGLRIETVLPLSIGLETLGGIFTRIVERNTQLPASKSQIFSTAVDNQSSVEVNVLQGERLMAADNRSLGKFVLREIPPLPRGMPQIEVRFNVDANGVINVSAKDLATGRVEHSILTTSDLSTAEVNQLTEEAELYSESDLAKLKLAEALIRIQALTFQIRNATEHYNLDQKSIQNADDAIRLAEQLVEIDATEEAIEILNIAWNRLLQQVRRIQREVSAEGISAGADFDSDADVQP